MSLKRAMVMVLILTLLTALPVMAQDSGDAVANQEAGGSGITTLVILSGLAGVLFVGGLIYRRENAKDGKEVD
ncbi:MAG: hypothetical protein R3E39_20055 [Anaerolineae bacterium]